MIKRAELADNLVTETKYLKLNNFFSTKTHSLWEVNGFWEKDKPFNYLAQKCVDSQSCEGWWLPTIMVKKYMDPGNKSAFEAEKHNWTIRMTRFTQ